MSRKTLVTLLLIILSALLAVALFIAGAIWRGRVTAGQPRSTAERAVLALASYNAVFLDRERRAEQLRDYSRVAKCC